MQIFRWHQANNYLTANVPTKFLIFYPYSCVGGNDILHPRFKGGNISVADNNSCLTPSCWAKGHNALQKKEKEKMDKLYM
jgi:hypothetical protein